MYLYHNLPRRKKNDIILNHENQQQQKQVNYRIKLESET